MAVRRYKGKKSLKQPDEFITFSSKLLQQVIEHRNKIYATLGGIVVLVLIISVVNFFSQKAENQSLLMLSKAIGRYETLQGESGDVEAYNGIKDDLVQITETYGSKSGGKFANFFLANCSFAAGEYQASSMLYRKAVADFRSVYPFEHLAKSSLGYALAQQGDHEAAADVFEELSAADALGMEDEVLFALARQYGAMGKTDLQKETAQKLIETYPESIYTNVMKEKLGLL
jgi:tetratricopeptide (TPR) repeat protein